MDQTAQFEWKVSDDRLSVLLKATPPGVSQSTGDKTPPSTEPPPSQVSLEALPHPLNGNLEAQVLEIAQALAASRIVCPLIREKALEELKHPSGNWVIIARGTPPTPPIDAALEYLVDLDNFNRPILEEDSDKVDHKNLHLILNVKEGQALVRKHDAIPGEPGMDVYGEPVPPREPMEVAIPPGEGVSISEDGRFATAAVDGALAAKQAATLERRRGGKGEAVRLFEETATEEEKESLRKKRRISTLNVTRLHRIVGDVGYKTGNIEFNGSVEINGNILSGFEVRAADDIVVHGVVEGAQLEAGGAIRISQGIQGGGKAVLKAGEGIFARFGAEARLEAGTVIEMATHLHHCEVAAGEEVLVSGARGVIAGGEVRAGRRIRAKVAGSTLGVKTILHLGVVEDLNHLIRHTEEEIEKETTRLAGLEEILMQLNEIRKKLTNLSKDQEEVRIRAIRDQFKVMRNLDTLNAELVNAQQQRENARSGRVTVEQTVYPGVLIRFPEGKYPVGHAMRHVEFYFAEGEVRTRAL